MVLIKEILQSAARNGSQPLMDWAVNHPQADVKTLTAALSNPHCPDELVTSLMTHRQSSARAAAFTTHPDHPEVLDLLGKEPSKTVLRAAFFAGCGTSELWMNHPHLRGALKGQWSLPRTIDVARRWPEVVWEMVDLIPSETLTGALVQVDKEKVFAAGVNHPLFQEAITPIVISVWEDGYYLDMLNALRNVAPHVCKAVIDKHDPGHDLAERLDPESSAHKAAVRKRLPYFAREMDWKNERVKMPWWITWDEVLRDWLDAGYQRESVAAALTHSDVRWHASRLTFDERVDVALDWLTYDERPADDCVYHLNIYFWQLFDHDYSLYHATPEDVDLKRRVMAALDAKVDVRRAMDVVERLSYHGHTKWLASGPVLSGRLDGLLPYLTPLQLEDSPDGHLALALWLSSLPDEQQVVAESLLTSASDQQLRKIAQMTQAVVA